MILCTYVVSLNVGIRVDILINSLALLPFGTQKEQHLEYFLVQTTLEYLRYLLLADIIYSPVPYVLLVLGKRYPNMQVWDAILIGLKEKNTPMQCSYIFEYFLPVASSRMTIDELQI